MTLVAAGCRPDIATTLERADAGGRLSAQEAYAFEHTTSSELLALLHVADALRGRHHGAVITYSRKVFLPLTNLCRDYCGYCTFRKDPGDPGAKTMTLDPKTHRIYLVTAALQAAPASAGQSKPTVVPGTFKVLVYGME